jgi:hypothetical protein
MSYKDLKNAYRNFKILRYSLLILFEFSGSYVTV